MKVLCQFWNLAGSDLSPDITRFPKYFFKATSGIIVLDDTIDNEPFTNLKDWLLLVSDAKNTIKTNLADLFEILILRDKLEIISEDYEIRLTHVLDNYKLNLDCNIESVDFNSEFNERNNQKLKEQIRLLVERTAKSSSEHYQTQTDNIMLKFVILGYNQSNIEKFRVQVLDYKPNPSLIDIGASFGVKEFNF